MPIDTILALMVEIFIMVAVGFLLKKNHVIDDDFQNKLSGLLVGAVLPLSVLATGNKEYSPAISQGLVKTGLIGIAYYLISIVVMLAIARLLKLQPSKKGVFVTLGVFANTAFIGYPIAGALFGNEGVLYAVVYNLLFQTFLFTIGVRLLDSGQKMQWKPFLTSPLTISSVSSLLIFVSPFRFPAPVTSAFQTIGSMSVPLSMIIIGCSLADMKFFEIWSSPLSYIVSAFRLAIFPLAMLFVLRLLGISGVAASTCVLLTALPPGALNVIMAQRYKGDVKFATQAVVQGMILMFPGLLLVLFALEKFL